MARESMSAGTRCRRSTWLWWRGIGSLGRRRGGRRVRGWGRRRRVGRDDAATTGRGGSVRARARTICGLPGKKIAAIGRAATGRADLGYVTYLKGKAGINRASTQLHERRDQSRLEEALKAGALASVHELVAMANGATCFRGALRRAAAIQRPRPLQAQVRAPDAAAGGDGEGASPARLDLATFTRCAVYSAAPRDADPFQPGRPALCSGRRRRDRDGQSCRAYGTRDHGHHFAVWPHRRANAAARDVRSKSVVETSSELGKEAERKLLAEDTAGKSEPALSPGEGELDIVDKAFGRQPAVLVRGDEAGTGAALGLLSEHFPNLWETGKEHESARRDPLRPASLLFPAISGGAGCVWAVPPRAVGRRGEAIRPRA